MVAEVHRRRAETAPPPEDALNRAQAAYNTVALLRGAPFTAIYAHALASHDGPSWDEVSAAFDTYGAKSQLGYVLRGIDVPLRADAAFVPVPQRDAFTASYRSHQQHVNKTFAKDASDGRVLLFSAAAAHKLRELGFHDNPLGHVRKSSEPLGAGRPTCNASKGPGRAHFLGSVNHATDQEALLRLIGPASVHTILDLAIAVEQAAHSSVDGTVSLACVDIRSCFKHVRFSAQSALLLGSAVLDTHAAPGEEAVAWAVPVGANFGWTGSPAAMSRVTSSAHWLVHHACSDRWYEAGLLCVGRKGTPLGPSAPRWACTWVDDSAIVGHDDATCTERLASLCRAYELLLRPHSSRWSQGPPPGVARGAATPDLNFADCVIADSKTVWPNSTIDYSGWTICGASRSICLSAKGWLALVATVFIDLAAPVVTGAVLERCVHVLRHYTAICPVAEAFTASLWHALKKAGRTAARVEMSPCRTDMNWWEHLIRAALLDPEIFAWRTQAIAGLLRPTVAVESDASGFGGGLIFTGAINLCFKFEFCGSERAGSAGLANTDYEINILECAAFVAGLAAAAPMMVGAVVDVALDNTSAISWCRRMRTKKASAALLLRWLGFIMFKFNIQLSFRHLAGILNIDADALSRWSASESRSTFRARHPSPSSPFRSSAIRSLPTAPRALVWQALAVQPTSLVFDEKVARSTATRALD